MQQQKAAAAAALHPLLPGSSGSTLYFTLSTAAAAATTCKQACSFAGNICAMHSGSLGRPGADFLMFPALSPEQQGARAACSMRPSHPECMRAVLEALWHLQLHSRCAPVSSGHCQHGNHVSHRGKLPHRTLCTDVAYEMDTRLFGGHGSGFSSSQSQESACNLYLHSECCYCFMIRCCVTVAPFSGGQSGQCCVPMYGYWSEWESGAPTLWNLGYSEGSQLF
jgi:hypothetical protein